MKKYINIIITTLILAGCTERIDIKVDNTYKRLVVDGCITTDTTKHRVKLTTTSDYFYNQPSPPVTGADVRISDGSKVFLLAESATEPGVYETTADVYGEIGKTYILSIANVDVNDDKEIELYTAESRINPVSPIDSIKLFYTALGPDSVFAIMVYAQDPPTTEFYVFKASINGVLAHEKATDLWIQDDVLFNGNYTNGIWSQFLFQSGPTKRPEEHVAPGDIVTFERNSITKDYYSFLAELQSNAYYNPIFRGPPANTRSNVSNGAIGYFSAYSIARCNRVVPAKPWILDYPY